MALTFFWRCEGTTLDGTHDYSAGDTTATATGSATIEATAAKIGSNGLLLDTGERYSFDAASIVSKSLGCVGFWIKFVSALPTTGQIYWSCRGTSSNDYIQIQSASNGAQAQLVIRNSTNGSVTLATGSGTVTSSMTTGNWYFIVARWDIANDDRRIEVYDSTLSLIQYHSDLTTDLAAYEPADFNGTNNLRFGDNSGSVPQCYIDNCFIADTYAEAIQDKANITSYTEYAAAAGQPTGSRYSGIPGMNLISSRFGRGW